jgi:hypothetical protein
MNNNVWTDERIELITRSQEEIQVLRKELLHLLCNCFQNCCCGCERIDYEHEVLARVAFSTMFLCERCQKVFGLMQRNRKVALLERMIRLKKLNYMIQCDVLDIENCA